ncbi:hypothetical protein CYMTET_48027 [Cymbomonas tetramitiformis]|uniref:Uncharacterized protein n=1 Tax=Cymbomonas tetramitiformis TaxID=36881 RepID=A0AAE0BUX7_9CHLO|nr:hypothetical protein CYMTET_48027 [Cymbomonas tetramitiformis]
MVAVGAIAVATGGENAPGVCLFLEHDSDRRSHRSSACHITRRLGVGQAHHENQKRYGKRDSIRRGAAGSGNPGNGVTICRRCHTCRQEEQEAAATKEAGAQQIRPQRQIEEPAANQQERSNGTKRLEDKGPTNALPLEMTKQPQQTGQDEKNFELLNALVQQQEAGQAEGGVAQKENPPTQLEEAARYHGGTRSNHEPVAEQAGGEDDLELQGLLDDQGPPVTKEWLDKEMQHLDYEMAQSGKIEGTSCPLKDCGRRKVIAAKGFLIRPGHPLGGCLHPRMRGITTSRADAMAELLAKELRNHRKGGCWIIAYMGKKEGAATKPRILPDFILTRGQCRDDGKDNRRARTTEGPADRKDDIPSFVDMVLIEGLECATENSRMTQKGGPTQVIMLHLIEIAHTDDEHWGSKLVEKWTKYRWCTY